MKPLKLIWESRRLQYALLAGFVIALLLILQWQGGFFTRLRLQLNDLYFAPSPTTDNIVIVAIDEESLERYGTTPDEWSRSVYVDFIDTLVNTNTRVLSFDLLFSEAETGDQAFADALVRLRQNDTRTRIVLADAGFNVLADNLQGELPQLPYADELSLVPALSESADYHGYTNSLPDLDGVVRRQPSLLQINGEIGYSFSVATYLAYLRIPSIASAQVISADNGDLLVTNERRIPTDQYGLWQPYYFGAASTESQQTFPIVSFADVIDGNVDPEVFDDKIVLVGLINTAGTLDQYQVPSFGSGSLMAGIEIQANAIESLIQNSFVTQMNGLPQTMVIIVLSFFASLAYALPKWYFKLVLAVIFSVLWLILTSIVFSQSYIMIGLFDTWLALVLPVITAIGIDFTLEQRTRQQKEFILSSLHGIALQHLNLEQAADYILADVEQIIPGIKATLHIHQREQSHMIYKFERDGQQMSTELINLSTDDDAELTHYPTIHAIKREGNRTTVPILWQKRQQGFLTLQGNFKPSSEALLKSFLEQLAPNIDNMLLYDEIQRQKALVDAVFAESPAGIAIIDETGRVEQCNLDLAVILSSTIQKLNGQSLPELIGKLAENTDVLAQRFNAKLQSGNAFEIDEVILGEQAVQLKITPLDAYNLWIVMVIDITALVELGKLKTKMLRMASHDLKNPLSRIMGFAELIEMDGQLDKQNQKFLNYIDSSAKEMHKIIKDILDNERLRSGKVTEEDINLNELVQQVCASHQPDIIQKQQVFTLNIPPKIIQTRADVSQISQAITNLVGNAIKYTPEAGNVDVNLTSEAGTIRFEVKDTGYGIPQNAQDELFTEFYRAKSLATSHIQGTGLGLSLVKSVIEAHDGEVGFTSVEGQGSTFYFTLPEIITSETEHYA